MAFPSLALYVHNVVRGTGDTTGSLYLRKENKGRKSWKVEGSNERQ